MHESCHHPYYARNDDGELEAWIQKAKGSMKSIIPQYNSIRMVMDYLREYYAPAKLHGRRLRQDDAVGARELATWKHKISQAWPHVQLRLESVAPQAVSAGESMPIEVAVNLNGLEPNDIVVDCVLGRTTDLEEFVPTASLRFTAMEDNAKGETIYRVDLCASDIPVSGLQHYKIRAYPHHGLLAHRSETGCMLWL